MVIKSRKAVILVLVEWFYPAFRAGGPITSCVNFVNACASRYDIKVLTSAYDLDGTEVVDKPGQSHWVAFGSGSEVYYTSREEMNLGFIFKVINIVQPDFIYCNGMFSVNFTIFPLLARLMTKTSAKFVLAPRGMLKPSALAYKQVKKRVFLTAFKISGLSKRIRFHATDLDEMRDIQQEFGISDIVVVGNFPSPVSDRGIVTEKVPGKLNLLFLGRIHEIKQLHYLLDRLMKIEDDILLTIIGPLEDVQYWQSCLQRIKQLPVNIKVDYIGEKSPDSIKAVFASQHVMALPTKGENFGHAIFESFANGKPVIISNRTPWQDLESEQTGFVCSLDNIASFEYAIHFFAGMDQSAYTTWSQNAFNKADRFIADSELFSKYDQLFS